MSDLPLPSHAPWNQPWPASELERVQSCPICGSAERTVAHEHMVDNVFFAAPGRWTLHACRQCGGAYLDPRPSAESVHRAYINYYTHKEAASKDDYASLSPLRKLRRRLVNGYTKWRYSTHAAPATGVGVLALMAMYPYKTRIDRKYRHLPRLPSGGGTLLDVGCGNGSFLVLARTCGWDVFGLDPDPQAIFNAAKQGMTVHQGGIEFFAGQTNLFNVITLNHVVEHVHDPVKVLKTCHALLKAGGQLWLETPNIDSFGHARFKQNWRGLETPRHLVLFNRHSLGQALANAGFPSMHDLPSPSPCAGMYRASYAIQHGYSPYDQMATPTRLKLQAMWALVAEMVFPKHREFLTVAVRKGDS